VLTKRLPAPVLTVQLVNHVQFSPDGRWVASGSFDKSVKLWDGFSGKFVATFRNHVGPIYQIRSVLMRSACMYSTVLMRSSCMYW